jgi:hypothetical protein
MIGTRPSHAHNEISVTFATYHRIEGRVNVASVARGAAIRFPDAGDEQQHVAHPRIPIESW